MKELAKRLKELKKVYVNFSVKGKFKFDTSALKLFEMPDMNMSAVTD